MEYILPLAPFILGILLKTLLDFNLAFWIVKFFYWIPVRSIFRSSPYNLNGKWVQHWDNITSDKYQSPESRTSEVNLKQFGKYCYGEYRILNDEFYYIFGEIKGKNFVGKWGDKMNELGYFGAFELRIIDKNNLEGQWLGHSNKNPDKINANAWIWKR